MTEPNADGFIFGGLRYIQFPKDNNIHYYQDLELRKNVPSGVKFYPEKKIMGGISFMGENHGFQLNNQYGLIGNYGSGSIIILLEELPKDVQQYCLENLLAK